MTSSTNLTDYLESFPPLPLDDNQWQAIVAVMHLSPKQAKVVELVFRDMGDKQIATVMGIKVPTVREYLKRIFLRANVTSRMGLAMHVLGILLKPGDAHHCHQDQ